jgi:hypothetical protein
MHARIELHPKGHQYPQHASPSRYKWQKLTLTPPYTREIPATPSSKVELQALRRNDALVEVAALEVLPTRSFPLSGAIL